LYPQTQKIGIEDSLKYGTASTFLIVLWDVTILVSSITTSVPTFGNVTTSTSRTVPTSWDNIKIIAHHTLMVPNSICLCKDDRTRSVFLMLYVVLVFKDPSWLNLTNDSYHADVVHNMEFVDTILFSTLQLFNPHGMVMHHCDCDSSHLRSDFSKPPLVLHLLPLWYIDEADNKVAHKRHPTSNQWHHSWPAWDITFSRIALPSTNPIFTTLLMLVMLAMSLLLLLLQGTGWLLLAMADPPIGRTAENHILAAAVGSKLLRRLKDVSGRSISSSGMSSRKFSSKVLWSLWGCVIAGSVPVEWILRWIMLEILPVILPCTSGEEEQKFVSGRPNPSVHTLVTARWIFLASHLCCTPPAWPNSGRTLNSAVCQADRQWWKAVMVRAMNIRLIFSINDLSVIPICHMP